VAGAIITAWAEQQFQRGVPVILGALGGFIIEAIEASLINKRLGSRTGSEAPRLIVVGVGTIISLALGITGLLPSIERTVVARYPQCPLAHPWPARAVTGPRTNPTAAGGRHPDGSSKCPR
jgi:hypothetical protein